MDQAHRKIELQSPADLCYLINNANKRARERLDVHFPPTAAAAATTTKPTSGNEVDMRDRVDQLITSYIENTYTSLSPNISVNGMDAPSSYSKMTAPGNDVDAELEPYDHKLASRLQDASSQIEALTLELANIRRSAPAKAKRDWEETNRVRDEAWKSKLAEAETRTMESARDVHIDVEGLEADRAEDLERTWERAQRDLKEAEKGIGGTIARLERAREVVGYLEGKS